MKRHRFWILLCAYVGALLCALPARADKTDALALAAVKNEPPFKVRRHFVVSNERRHDLFLSDIHDVGGAYVGVGADQNYTLIAAARSEAAWIIDIDADVIAWHDIYAALLAATPSRADFVYAFSGAQNPQVRFDLERWWSPMKVDRLWKVFRRDRAKVYAYLVELGMLRKGPNWLSDKTYFDHVRKLVVAEKIVARVGNLHAARGALLDIGELSHARQIPVQVVYLSNAEQWAPYTPAFRNNMRWLHHKAGAVVLRTMARPDLPAARGDRWHYSVQPLSEFTRMLDSDEPLGCVQDLTAGMSRASGSGSRQGLSHLGGVPKTVADSPQK